MVGGLAEQIDGDDRARFQAELASGGALSTSLTLEDTHSPVVALGIHGGNVGGQAPAVVPLVIKVPTTIETLETTGRRHVGLSLMQRKACVLGAIRRIGSKRTAGSGKDTRRRQRGCGDNAERV